MRTIHEWIQSSVVILTIYNDHGRHVFNPLLEEGEIENSTHSFVHDPHTTISNKKRFLKERMFFLVLVEVVHEPLTE